MNVSPAEPERMMREVRYKVLAEAARSREARRDWVLRWVAFVLIAACLLLVVALATGGIQPAP